MESVCWECCDVYLAVLPVNKEVENKALKSILFVLFSMLSSSSAPSGKPIFVVLFNLHVSKQTNVTL